MNETREIVTKAIVEKGKKTIRLTEKIKTSALVESILGCWILNHHFQAEKSADGVLIIGEFETHIWFSFNGNSKTEVIKHPVRYQENIVTKRKVKEYTDNNLDVIVRIIQPPVCSDVKIIEDSIEAEILLEATAEVIGETKIRVSVLDLMQNYDNDEEDTETDDIDNKINPQFLREKLF